MVGKECIGEESTAKRRFFTTVQKIVPHLGALSVASYAMLLWLPVSFDLALYTLVVVAASAIWLAEPGPLSAWPWPDGLMVLLLLALSASICFSSDFYRSLVLSSAFVPAGLLYLMITRYVREPTQLLIPFLGFTLGGFGISCRILTQAFSSADPLELVQDAAVPLLVVPNDVLLLCLIAPLSLSLFVVARSRLIKATAVSAIAATVACVVVLQSRSGLIVLGFSTLIASLGLPRIATALKSLLVGLLAALAFDALFELGQLAGQLLVQRQRLTQPNKGAHDGDIHLSCLFAAKDAGQHGHALLGESARQVLEVPTSL